MTITTSMREIERYKIQSSHNKGKSWGDLEVFFGAHEEEKARDYLDQSALDAQGDGEAISYRLVGMLEGGGYVKIAEEIASIPTGEEIDQVFSLIDGLKEAFPDVQVVGPEYLGKIELKTPVKTHVFGSLPFRFPNQGKAKTKAKYEEILRKARKIVNPKIITSLDLHASVTPLADGKIRDNGDRALAQGFILLSIFDKIGG